MCGEDVDFLRWVGRREVETGVPGGGKAKRTGVRAQRRKNEAKEYINTPSPLVIQFRTVKYRVWSNRLSGESFSIKPS